MKLARFVISPELLVVMGSGIFRVVQSSIPEDATVHQTTIDPLTGLINIFLLSETFPELPDGSIVPLIEAPEIQRMEFVQLAQFVMDRLIEITELADCASSFSNEALREELRKWLIRQLA